jgi:hypothetical protein
MFETIKKELSKKTSGKNIGLVKLRGGGKNKVLFFAFADNSTLPFLCLKAPSFPDQNHLIELEFKNLQGAVDALPKELKNTVPTPLYLFEADGYRISVEETVNAKQAGFNMKGGEINRVADWLRTFHKSGMAGKAVIDKNFLANLLLKYKKADSETINLVLDIWGGRSAELPLIKQHGDFHFANIYFSDKFLKVIDWSGYGNVILPAYDLIFFLRRQKKGINENEKIIRDYFDYFSIPQEIFYQWIKILEIIENLEKNG